LLRFSDSELGGVTIAWVGGKVHTISIILLLLSTLKILEVGSSTSYVPPFTAKPSESRGTEPVPSQPLGPLVC